jgi:hypothetical protein
MMLPWSPRRGCRRQRVWAGQDFLGPIVAWRREHTAVDGGIPPSWGRSHLPSDCFTADGMSTVEGVLTPMALGCIAFQGSPTTPLPTLERTARTVPPDSSSVAPPVVDFDSGGRRKYAVLRLLPPSPRLMPPRLYVVGPPHCRRRNGMLTFRLMI